MLINIRELDQVQKETFEAGRQAALAGKSRKANPHFKDCIKYHYWVDGYTSVSCTD